MGYHETIWRALRGLAVCTWVPERRTWSFPLAAHDAVLAALGRASGVRTRVEPLPPVAAAVLGAQGRWTDESARGGSLPAQLSSALLPFQKQGLAFALSRGGRCLVGDEMGLGKTVQALAAAACFREEWPLLVLAPSSLREAWAEALHRWLGLEAGQVLVAQSGRDAARVAQVAADGVRGGILACVVSYSLAPKLDAGDATLGSFSGGSLPRKKAKKGLSASSAPSSALSPLPTWRVVIADEAHYLKDASSQRSLAVVPLLKAARRAFLLTGTPALNKPKELFPLLSALLPDASLRMKDFGERYCAGTRWDRYGGACNLTELHALLQTVMIRRLKRDVLPQLPRKRRQQVLLALDAPARRELGALGSRMERASAALAAAEARGGGLRAGGEDGALVMELYRRSAELKVPAVQEYVRMLLEAGTKCIIFAHHTALLDGVEHELRRFAGARRGGAAPGASFVRITGSTPAGERQALVDRFQQREEVRVALLSIKAAGVGLTLTAASVVVFAELTWTPGEVVQAEDRAHRIGQASAVNVYFLHAKGSIDDLIWAAIQSKLEAVGQVLDGVEGGMELEGGVRAAPDRRQRLLAPMLNANKGGGS